MGVRGRGRVTRSGAEWAELFERFESSGLSGAAFCQREGISKSSFGRWKRLLRAGPGTGAFVEWTPPAPASLLSEAPMLASGELEVSFPGGVRLRFRP